MTKTAVILFNLGGPDSPDAVQPFLKNLFSDPAILRVPAPVRWFLARLISSRRAPLAREIYDHIGGKSPLLELTLQQAEALQQVLEEEEGETRVFPCMRYWHPMSEQVASEVKNWGAERVILLPLYPQFSTTTTGSSLDDWHRAAKKAGLNVPSRTVCCYPSAPGLLVAQAELLRTALKKARRNGAPRVLFSAHGLPQKVVDAGDPYAAQVEMTAQAIVDELAAPDLDWTICYQSKVGPLQWLEPSTEQEIERAAADNVVPVIVPVAFVSEHSETLVELDIEYKQLAEEAGVPGYVRVPAVGTHPEFIEALAELYREAILRDTAAPCPSGGQRICPKKWRECPCT